MTSWHQKNTVRSKTLLEGLHSRASFLVLRYILNQNGRHDCLLAYTSKHKLLLTRLHLMSFIYTTLILHLLFSVQLFESMRAGMGAKGELNLFIPEYMGFKYYYYLLGCMGGEMHVLMWHSQTFLWTCTLQHKLDLKGLSNFTSKSESI